eukprot:CAMPEP_0113676846 /NCGR_PEP_ID=MMETSP0038_2-20120614/8896_1 /TAXON_ID=2898 /ORGANISM="Cryptomonas paramecium" /LENGTH=281 /DNA_ID=CAMNT_0000593973 /DNA_START=91 /DNA_END=936 /DNA_ORIENTATION=- /assembly_acc=CAM_ASM_000170
MESSDTDFDFTRGLDSDVKVPSRLSRQVFIGGLPTNVTQSLLRAWAEKTYPGRVVNAVLVVDKKTHSRPRGFGFVTFDSVEAANFAVQKHMHDFDGKPVEIKKAENFGQQGFGTSPTKKKGSARRSEIGQSKKDSRSPTPPQSKEATFTNNLPDFEPFKVLKDDIPTVQPASPNHLQAIADTIFGSFENMYVPSIPYPINFPNPSAMMPGFVQRGQTSSTQVRPPFLVIPSPGDFASHQPSNTLPFQFGHNMPASPAVKEPESPAAWLNDLHASIVRLAID